MSRLSKHERRSIERWASGNPQPDRYMLAVGLVALVLTVGCSAGAFILGIVIGFGLGSLTWVQLVAGAVLVGCFAGFTKAAWDDWFRWRKR